MKPYNVYVTVAYPPDTDTPGFAEENKTKVSVSAWPLELSVWFPVLLAVRSVERGSPGRSRLPLLPSL